MSWFRHNWAKTMWTLAHSSPPVGWVRETMTKEIMVWDRKSKGSLTNYSYRINRLNLGKKNKFNLLSVNQSKTDKKNTS